MQYVRLFIGSSGAIEHSLTSTKPISADIGVEVHDPVGILPGMSQDEIRLLPTRKAVFDTVDIDLETTDGKFHRAREVMDSLIVNKSTLTPRLRGKTVRKFDGTIHNLRINRANRGQQ